MNRTYDQWKESFIDKVRVRMQVDADLKDRGDVVIQPVSRVNVGILEGITMPYLTEAGLSPVIFLNDLYEEYQSGIPEDILVWRTVNQFSAGKDVPFNMDAIKDYAAVKDDLRFRVSGYEQNRGWAEAMVSVKEGDFVYSCYLPIYHEAFGRASISITKENAVNWGVSYEQILMDAKAGSMKQPVELKSTMEILGEACDLFEGEPTDYYAHPEHLPEEENLFVLREKDSLYGASVIARADVLKQVGKILNDDYYVLPSSTQEVLLIPAKRWNDPERLAEMVREINETEVEPRERLTDHVQFYDRSRERLMNAVEYRYQKRSQERMDSGRIMARNRSVRDDYER